MQISITIELGNETMSRYDDVADALAKLAETLRHGTDDLVGAAEAGRIRDINGNTVGTWEVTA